MTAGALAAVLPVLPVLGQLVVPTAARAQGFSLTIGGPDLHIYNGTRMVNGVTRLLGNENGVVKVLDVVGGTYTEQVLALPRGTTLYDLNGLSPNGRYVAATVDASGLGGRAVIRDLWQTNTLPQLVPLVGTRTAGQSAFSVSDLGVIAGYDDNQAFIGTAASSVHLVSGPFIVSFATGITRVGGTQYVAGSAFNQACFLTPALWTAGVLTFLPATGVNGTAFRLSSDARYGVGTLDGYLSYWDLAANTQRFVQDQAGKNIDGFFTSALPSGLMAGNTANGGSVLYFPGMPYALSTADFFQQYLGRTLGYTPSETWAIWDEGNGLFGMASIASAHLEVGVDPAAIATVPEPASEMLLGLGLITLGGVAARRGRIRLTS